MVYFLPVWSPSMCFMDNTSSQMASGVPQATLGPLRFLIFINDAYIHVNNSASQDIIYANDTAVLDSIDTDSSFDIIR